MASSSTLLFVYFASPPSSVHPVNTATNEEICLKRKLWSRVSRRANEARIGCTLSAEFGRRSTAIQFTGGKILSHNTASRAKHNVDLGCRDNSTLIYSGHDYPNWRCINECCTRINIIMYGYWMGPDIEDGWGYTEAFVDLSF
ncbi:uncharacterized protein LOC113361677 isoform X2 [Papaver somniferum]|uniref:uncharacterized protein LOC113361677 isoform X2 n=1 Tax=Papaver somniferum TaxID=3469 RepID=UPI000E6F7AC2|nr:uncharacterized protein LOC113361677 isoform X2 [Papaver somniferum]